MGSFVFNREKARLEKEINMQVQRYWYTKTWHQHLEGRRKEIEMRVKGHINVPLNIYCLNFACTVRVHTMREIKLKSKRET